MAHLALRAKAQAHQEAARRMVLAGNMPAAQVAVNAARRALLRAAVAHAAHVVSQVRTRRQEVAA